MNEQLVTKKIVSIMKDKLSFQFDENMDNISEKPFFGKHFRLQPYELAYLLMEIEKEFDITIPEEYLLDPGVKTIDDFTRYIQAV